MNYDWNPYSVRARKARAGKQVGIIGYQLLFFVACLLFFLGAVLLALGIKIGLSAIGLGLLILPLAIWVQKDLLVVPTTGNDLNERLHGDVLARLPGKGELTPDATWTALSTHWQSYFFTNHLLLPVDFIGQHMSKLPTDMMFVWQYAVQYADNGESKAIEVGHVISALLATNPAIGELLTHLKHSPKDIDALSAWLSKELAHANRPKQSFGGIGRDWANGFTPRLNQFGTNLSLGIERHNIHFGDIVDSHGVLAIKNAFSQGAAAVALIGDEGIGKTTHAYALAQNLLAESKDPSLAHRQIIALRPAGIISAAQRPGDLEHIVTLLMNEASHAGNIILFMDDAAAFFHDGPGQFNATQLLLPVIQSRTVQFILAMTPREYEGLKGANPALAGQLTPVVIRELDEAGVMDALTSTATTFEGRQKVLIAYEALQEAYRLSGRYDQDSAYPGKAIRLLEQSLAHANGGVINAASVQAAIEQTKGVRVSDTKPAEATQLLNLEDEIHKRMINQSRAVSVVANALRRARAGVGNQGRPIGSFLFLGPTGVGKTELAKAVAATYFGNEHSMIRLDMSEYQESSDVRRILSGDANETSSLILKVRQQPFSVVLLDEIEKAHPNILNLLLQLLDEGQLTDITGRKVSFRDAVIIATSNAGADTIRTRIEQGEQLESFERSFVDELIENKEFKPELLNRFDEIVLFRPLKPEELAQVVRLMLNGINQTLANQNIAVELTDAAVMKIVAVGNDPRLGARPMRRALQRAVEDTVAGKILRGEAGAGDRIMLDAADLTL